MRKGWAITILIVLTLVISIGIGIYDYQKNNTKDSNMPENKQLAKQEEYINDQMQQNLLATVSIEEKTSPNCVIIEKQYFKDCDHIIRNVKQIPEEYMNMTKEELEKQYKNWKVEEFSTNQVVVYKEEEGFCKQHYVIRDHNGVIGIYYVDENGKENWKEDTEVQTMYLPEEDLEEIKKGISIIGNAELYSTIGDYE